MKLSGTRENLVGRSPRMVEQLPHQPYRKRQLSIEPNLLCHFRIEDVYDCVEAEVLSHDWSVLLVHAPQHFMVARRIIPA